MDISQLFLDVRRAARLSDASIRHCVCRFTHHKLRNKDKTLTSRQRNYLRMNTTGSALTEPKTLYVVFQKLPPCSKGAISFVSPVFFVESIYSQASLNACCPLGPLFRGPSRRSRCLRRTHQRAASTQIGSYAKHTQPCAKVRPGPCKPCGAR